MKILGYKPVKETYYTADCTSCGAILEFEESEVKNTYANSDQFIAVCECKKEVFCKKMTRTKVKDEKKQCLLEKLEKKVKESEELVKKKEFDGQGIRYEQDKIHERNPPDSEKSKVFHFRLSDLFKIKTLPNQGPEYCLHNLCENCKGTGKTKDNRFCVHAFSCSCHVCTAH